MKRNPLRKCRGWIAVHMEGRALSMTGADGAGVEKGHVAEKCWGAVTFGPVHCPHNTERDPEILC